MRFYVEKCEAMRNFANKIWNASRFVLMNLTIDEVKLPEKLELEDKWVLSKLNDKAVDEDFLKGVFLHLFAAGKDHPGYPEKDDIIARYQHGGGVEIRQFRRFLRGKNRALLPQRGRLLPLPERCGAADFRPVVRENIS